MYSFKFSLLLALAMVCVCTALVRPADPFDANEDARQIHQALIDSKWEVLSDILTRRTSTQRVAVAEAYKAKYKLDLVSEFEKYLSGDFKDLMTVMVIPIPEYFANELYTDARPFKYGSQAAVDILLTSSNNLLRDINDAYNRLQLNTYVTLSEALSIYSYSHGLSPDIMYAALSGRRSESQEIDEDAIKTEAEFINRLGEHTNKYQRRFDDERNIEDIFKLRSVVYLQKLFSEYEKLYGHGIEQAFEDRGWQGSLQRSVLNIINVYRSAPKYFAERLYYAMKGAGTDDRVLMRIIVSRAEIDLDEIKESFQSMYGASLADTVADDTSKEYRRALLLLIDS